MEKVIVDTDVFIDFLRGHKQRIKKIFTLIQQKEIKGSISLISVVELYSGKDCRQKEKLAVLNKLLYFFEIISPNLAIAKLAGNLKREYELGLADAIIAATAIEENAQLFTFNLKHFRKVPRLTMTSLSTAI
ncbi:type II toxin-antitoxin system VapC family toxin [Candidatus Gottesmanbacteria bacterium]|nr:type II toxin-antitoxin system VapC family toxin [Candidatus Gottesmanbacteria bacterium]